MASGLVTRTVGRAADRVPGLRRLPVVQLLMAAELALLARDHLQRLTAAERHRLVALVRAGRGGSSRLTETQRTELEALLAKLEPRFLLGEAVNRLSPVPLPRRLTHGRRRR